MGQYHLQYVTQQQTVDRYGDINESIIHTPYDPIVLGICAYNNIAFDKSVKYPNLNFALTTKHERQEALMGHRHIMSDWIDMIQNISTYAAKEEDATYTITNSAQWTLAQNVQAAKDLREYYTSRFTMQKLHEIELTQFQSELYSICSRAPNTIKERELSLLSTLMTMYHEDRLLDDCISKTTNGDITYGPIELELIDGTATLRKISDVVVYLREISTNKLVAMYLSDADAESLLIEQLLDTGQLKVNVHAMLLATSNFDVTRVYSKIFKYSRIK